MTLLEMQGLEALPGQDRDHHDEHESHLSLLLCG
jgi:Lanthionine-containing peptide SapB precursor RamS